MIQTKNQRWRLLIMTVNCPQVINNYKTAQNTENKQFEMLENMHSRTEKQ